MARARLVASSSSRPHSPAATLAYPSSNQRGGLSPSASCRARCASSCRRTRTGSPALELAARPCMTTRRRPGRATAAPHSGAPSPAQARKPGASGATITLTACRGRGRPGKVSRSAALASSARASASSCGAAMTVKRPATNCRRTSPCAPNGAAAHSRRASHHERRRTRSRAGRETRPLQARGATRRGPVVPRPTRSPAAPARSAFPMD